MSPTPATTTKAFIVEENGLFGLHDGDDQIIYEPIFQKFEAEELERLYNAENPPATFAEAVMLAERNGVTIYAGERSAQSYVAPKSQELNTIIAALRFYHQHNQGEPSARTDEIHALATNQDEDTSLDQDGIKKLISDLKSGKLTVPAGLDIPEILDFVEGLDDIIEYYDEREGCECTLETFRELQEKIRSTRATS